MDIVLQVIVVALFVFQILLVTRVVLELVQMFARDYRPGGFALVLFEAVYTVTDPPVRALRRLIPPIQLGGASVDLSVLILFVAIQVAIWIVSGLRVA
ncbi:MAG TPA: YggT family protein [Actinomycetes bacterium]|nr:YggT family protein [Actinomycetes bacterium]